MESLFVLSEGINLITNTVWRDLRDKDIESLLDS
jgi:hypothetical protein